MPFTAITLDGSSYSIRGTDYSHQQRKIGVTRRTLTGAVDRVESSVFDNVYVMTLVCTTTDLATLRTTYGKTTTGANKLDFIDAEGTHWNPLGSGTGILNTGVYFEGDINPKPIALIGWIPANRFLVQIRLVANAQNVLS